jgi:adenosylcobyric acid synthase
VKARAIMVLGTGSHVGKSLLTAALCRIFADAGYKVAPFKSQNMSLNSAATVEGLEIGRAQALQAEAARIAPSVHMNPILLKPAGHMTSQVIVRGKIWGRLSASDYHQHRVEELFPIVCESYETLASQYEVIVLEGAGSPAEINLKQHDIVNMRMAEAADAACMLVGDIDRGGVFAALLGTVELLDPPEQSRIRGFVINKFRGDLSLLEPGIRMMEDRLQKPCLGVVPFLPELRLDEEDSLGLPGNEHGADSSWLAKIGDDRLNLDRPLRVAVIAFPSFSNFTDFDALRSEPAVSVRFCCDTIGLSGADVIILPGSKQTVDDLFWMRRQGLDTAICAHASHSLIAGICGGMQMLGHSILDPDSNEHSGEAGAGEAGAGEAQALGLLPFSTRMNSEKITRQTSGALSTALLFGQPIELIGISGYEIHVGETNYLPKARPFSVLSGGEVDGCISAGTRIFGTYLHGIFDDDAFRHAFIAAARAFHHLAPAPALDNWKQKRENSLDRLANAVREALDITQILSWAGLAYHPEPHPENPESIR